MRMILLILIVGLLLVLGYAATRPDSFRIERSISIKAPPEKVFGLINDFQKWALWSPWDKKDPAMKRNLSGAAQGTGAIYTWEGNKDVGTGRMEIMESKASSKVSIKLNFMKPFEAQNTSEFSLNPKGEQTEVVWAMYGPQPFIAKLMSLFFNMEKMVGPDFEQGLAAMKSTAERPN
jgi:Polyketide cyclase / dehydrase and lipid transport